MPGRVFVVKLRSPTSMLINFDSSSLKEPIRGPPYLVAKRLQYRAPTVALQETGEKGNRLMIARMIFSLLLFAGVLMPLPAAAQPAPTREQANAALQKAVQFFRQQVSVEGGYLWQYSSDLSSREGEGKATATEAWVQSPGTPTVGLAYLNAYRRTGESYLLDAARQAATALVRDLS